MKKYLKSLGTILITSLLFGISYICHAEEGYFGANESSYAGNKDAAKTKLEKGNSYGMQGKFKKAKKELLDALKNDPASNKTKNSLKIIDDVLAGKLKRKAAIYIFKALPHYSDKNKERIEFYLTKSINADSGYALSHYLLAKNNGASKKWKKAIQGMSKVIEIDPEYKKAYHFRGLALHQAACDDWKTACDLGKCKKINKERERGNCP